MFNTIHQTSELTLQHVPQFESVLMPGDINYKLSLHIPLANCCKNGYLLNMSYVELKEQVLQNVKNHESD